MLKQIKKIDKSITKCEEGIVNCLDLKYQNNGLILELLNKREKILYKTKKKILKLNETNLVNFSF